MECPRWHRLGERCECGRITAPARFYHQEGQELHQDQVEAAYIKWAAVNGITIRGMQQVSATGRSLQQEIATESGGATGRVCCTCGRGFEGHGRECSNCRSRRSRLHPSV